MAFPEWLPLFITAVLGSTGITAALGRFAQLSGPARLRRRIQATAALAKELPEGQARHALELAVDRDAAYLSSMSLVRPSRFADLLGVIIYAVVGTVTLFVIFGYFVLNRTGGGPLADLRGEVISVGVPTLVTVTGLYIVVIGAIIVRLNTRLKQRRNIQADIIFARGDFNGPLIRALVTGMNADGTLMEFAKRSGRRRGRDTSHAPAD